MPRRSLDKGSKPFEFRTGIGGLPQLGGMFRSGDPAKIPPHKFHLLANIRRTPGGTITRPGLSLEFDTGIQECIDGLTEDAGEQGGAIMLYPGAESRPGNGGPYFNPATFRAIFPDSSSDYSEFAFALYGPASAVRGNSSPVLAYSDLGGGYAGPTFLSRPFIFRGQAVEFAMVSRNGIDTVALLGINLAQRSFLQASDCWRDTSRPNDGVTPSCPGVAGQPSVSLNDPPLWPFQHPIGSVGVLAYFDHPFPDTTIAWVPDASSAAEDIVIDQILTRQERVDDVLTGTSGVSEVLYFVARQDVAGPIRHRRLIRWDGAVQTTEAVTIPDDLLVGLSEQAYGPYLVSGGVDATAQDWAAIRGETGAWSVVGGVGWVVGPGAGEYAVVAFLPRAMSWGGKGQALIYGTWDGPGANDFGGIVFCMQQGAAAFDDDRGAQSCTLLYTVEANDNPVVVDAVVCGTKCYAIGYELGYTGYRLFVGDFRLGAVGGDTVTAQSSIFLSEVSVTVPPQLWIQTAGSRVYVGGKFIGWNPETAAVDVTHHGVYDVTGSLNETAVIFNVYRVNEMFQQLEDSGEGNHQADRYSRGAIPAVPGDDTGGQGFQAS